MALQKYTNWTYNMPMQDPPKFTQSGIFSSKINHLATLLGFSWDLIFMVNTMVNKVHTYKHVLPCTTINLLNKKSFF
jgi:hypothetical protein